MTSLMIARPISVRIVFLCRFRTVDRSYVADMHTSNATTREPLATQGNEDSLILCDVKIVCTSHIGSSRRLGCITCIRSRKYVHRGYTSVENHINIEDTRERSATACAWVHACTQREIPAEIPILITLFHRITPEARRLLPLRQQYIQLLPCFLTYLGRPALLCAIRQTSRRPHTRSKPIELDLSHFSPPSVGWSRAKILPRCFGLPPPLRSDLYLSRSAFLPVPP